MLGYQFEMDVEFPTILVQKQVGKAWQSDSRSSLIIHRIKLDVGDWGTFETTLNRLGQPEYTQLYEARPEDEYVANRPALEPAGWITVPVYDRNYNVKISLKSSHPSPCTLFSMSWEGDYNQRYYKNV